MESILEISNIASMNENTKLVELGVDSVKLIEVTALVEELYDVTISEEKMFALTIKDLVDFSKKIALVQNS